jgi:acetyl-CoA carboxylase carboxyltransferase component
MNEVKMEVNKNTEGNTELSMEDLKKVLKQYEEYIKQLQEANNKMLDYINNINVSRADLLVKLYSFADKSLDAHKEKILTEIFKSLKIE